MTDPVPITCAYCGCPLKRARRGRQPTWCERHRHARSRPTSDNLDAIRQRADLAIARRNEAILLRQQGWSLRKIARKLGVTHQRVADYLAGK